MTIAEAKTKAAETATKTTDAVRDADAEMLDESALRRRSDPRCGR